MKIRKLVLEILYDDEQNDDPAWWDWKELLDLGPYESVITQPLDLSPIEEGDPCPTCGDVMIWDEDERILFCNNDWSHG